MRRFYFVLCLLVLVVPIGGPAFAQDESVVIEALLGDGYYIENSYSLDGVARAIDDAGSDAPYLVALDENIPDPSAYAETLLDRIGFGSVIVITPQSIGGASFDHSAGDVDKLLDRVVDGLGPSDDLAAGIDAFAEGPGGISTGAVLVGVGLVGVGGVAIASARSRRKLEQGAAAQLEEARSELARQVDLVANDILELNASVQLADNQEVTDLYRTASATYADVESAVPGATSLADLERLTDQLDDARWELDAAETVLEGRPRPERPAEGPASCFFDPTHRAGTEEVELETPAGTQKVGVCRDCAQKLRAGTAPVPGSITVGGQPVPAPQAPRHSGGRGLDWLDVFSVIVDGSRIPYSVGRRPRQRTYGIPGTIPSPRRSRSTGGGGRSTTRSSGGSKRRTISRGRSRRR